jgi:DUF1009 family protein
MSAPGARSAPQPLAIYCCGGSLPVADAARRNGRDVHLYALRGWADAARVQAYPHEWGTLGQFGRFHRFLLDRRCKDIVFIGTLTRPTIWGVWPDLKALTLLPKIYSAFRGGDDHLLSAFGRIVEEHGFRLLGAHEVAPEILVPEGPVGRAEPSALDHADIARGLELLRATGPFDIGQAVVVAENRVLAIEAAEGTDRMLERLAALRLDGAIRWPARTGVLIKAPKPAQNIRLDLPTIGPRTVEMAAKTGLAGIAVIAGGTAIADAQQVAAAADHANLFVFGLRQEEPRG